MSLRVYKRIKTGAVCGFFQRERRILLLYPVEAVSALQIEYDRNRNLLQHILYGVLEQEV
jgi:hypothetical protein